MSEHAFVELVDKMGGDLSVVNSARVSYGKHSMELTEKDERLIHRLLKDRHGTPFEQATMTFYVRCPIFVAREWMRHRIGCLTGDTEITLSSESGKTVYKRTIKEIYDLKHGGVVDQMPVLVKNGTSKAGTPVFRDARRRYKNAERTRILPNCQDRTMRVLDEDTGLFTTGKMADVWETGVKEVYIVETEDGKSVRASAEHPFLTDDGWVKAKDLTGEEFLVSSKPVAANDRVIPPRLREGIGIWVQMLRRRMIDPRGATCYICGHFFGADQIDLDHVVPVVADLKLALDEDNIKPACKACHRAKSNEEQAFTADGRRKTVLGIKWVKIKSKPIIVGEEMTYDIEMEAPHHNYVANGLVVHNSFNEISGRYSQLPTDFYMPNPFRVPNPDTKQMDYKYIDADAELNEQAQIVAAHAYEVAQDAYHTLLEMGIAKEHARIILPVGLFTEFRWAINARSLMNFLSLRTAPGAMAEIRGYANFIEQLWATWMPVTAAAFDKYGRVAP
jgi:thymidylate synthase (FAD)